MPQVILYNPAEMREPKVPMVPMSLLAIATPLERKGFTVRIVDGRVEKGAANLVLDALQEDTICVGITCMSGTPILDALRVAQKVRETRRDLPIIWGGFHPSLLPEQTIGNDLVDALVIGQGEEAMTEMVTILQCNGSLAEVKGIVYKTDGQVHATPARPFTGFDTSLFIDYSLIEDLEKYVKAEVAPRTLDFITSRGCPYRCSFCAISSLYGRKWQPYPTEVVMDCMERLAKEHHIDGFHLFDDNFFVNRGRVEGICDEIIRRKIKAKFWAMCRCHVFSNFDETFLMKLKRAGFDTINFGAESGSQRILDLISKDMTREDILRTAELCKQHGFNAQFSFMTGFPFEEEADRDATIQLMTDVYSIDKGVDLKLFVYTPFPGSRLFDESIEYGFKPPESLSEWGQLHYENVSTPWTISRASYFETLAFMSFFAFTPTITLKAAEMRNPLYRLTYQLLRRDALWRWRHRFFRFPWEWRLVNYYMIGRRKKRGQDSGIEREDVPDDEQA